MPGCQGMDVRVRAALAGVAMLGVASCATVTTPPARTTPAAPIPVATRHEPAPIERIVGTSYVFSRGRDCVRRSKWWARNTQTCAADERMLVILTPQGAVETRPATDAAARGRYPGELVHQWRTCPFAADPALDARPDLFARYEDPDVGVCYLYRPTDGEALARLFRRARLGTLDVLHPILADATRQLVLRADAEGIELKVISTVRSHTARKQTVRVRGKDGRARRVTRTVRGPTLHSMGLAVDVNLMHRRDLGSATRAYLDGGPERDAWERVGRIGEELGLLWLGRVKASEIFHFEWRPGLSGMPKGAEKERLRRAQDRGGNPAVWELLRYDPDRPTAFRDLRDTPPDRM